MPVPASITNESTCTERLMTLYCPKSSMLRRLANSFVMANAQTITPICSANVHTTSCPIFDLTRSLMLWRYVL